MKVTQWCPTLCDPMNYTVHGILQARILEWVAFPFSRDLPNPGIKPRSPTLWADSLPAEPQGKPKNTGVDGLSVLQRIILTQELNKANWGILHCRRSWFDSWVEKIHGRKDRLPTPIFLGFPYGSAGKESAHNAGDLGLIPELGR